MENDVKWRKVFEDYMKAETPDERFALSIEMAKLSGVSEEEILKTDDEIDSFFMG